jgi:hypothetical protein
MKTCRTCGRELPIADFHIACHLVDGRSSTCKVCVNEARPQYRATSYVTNRRWKRRNRAALLSYQRKWREKNIEKVRADANSRYDNDYDFRIASVLRVRIHDVLKGKTKVDHTMNLLGCPIHEFREKLQAQFQLGMTWNNYGEWHIDHIVPCAAFNLSTAEAQRRCFHFSNLRPLWAADNLSKGAKITS